MNQERKRKGGVFQAVLALAVLYAAVALLPAAVYGASKTVEKPAQSPAPSSPSLSSAPPASSAQEAAPGFLDGLSLPEEENTAGEKDEFTLYDRSADKELKVGAKELLTAAIACEMDLASPKEALKAQAVACYTLFCRKREAGETIACDPEAWETWTTQEIMARRWGEDFNAHLELLQEVVDSVYGQVLTAEGEPILAAYFAISAGNTEACRNVWEADLPYLQAVASPGDLFADGYLSHSNFTLEEFQDAAASYFRDDPPDLSGDPESWLTEVERTPSGYVKSAVLGGKAVSGEELRGAFSLRSACFALEQNEEGFSFTIRGWGHGVGMSQAGAVFLAKRGEDYQAILSHYYPGAALTFPV